MLLSVYNKRNVIMQNEMYGALAVLSIFLALFVKLLIDMLGPSKPSDGKKVKKVCLANWLVPHFMAITLLYSGCLLATASQLRSTF